MRIIALSFLVYFISFYSFSQTDNYCGWEFPITANNAVIAIQQENFSNIYLSGNDLSTSVIYVECPMWIGVFYQTFEGGPLECAGYTEWDSSQSMAIAAWGDDPTTSEQDGFLDGDPYLFGLCIDGFGSFFGPPEMSIEPPFTDTYSTNGFASINSITFGPPVWSTTTITQACWPLNLSEENNKRYLLKTVDIYGRNVLSENSKGFIFHIYSDQTISKVYKF